YGGGRSLLHGCVSPNKCHQCSIEKSGLQCGRTSYEALCTTRCRSRKRRRNVRRNARSDATSCEVAKKFVYFYTEQAFFMDTKKSFRLLFYICILLALSIPIAIIVSICFL